MGLKKFKNTREKNGAVHTVSNIMKNVMVSDVEAKFGSLSHIRQEAEHICTTLQWMGHTQPETTTKAENYTANSIENNKEHQKLSKAMDMHFYWI